VKKACRFFKLFTLFCFSLNTFPNTDDYFLFPIKASASNYGNTGILETPNARFMGPASLRIHFSSSYPNEYTALTATPFDWFEATYRYTEIKNEKYGQSFYSGNQSLKDKGFDIKILAIEEKSLFPAVAIGLRDIAGTGLFSSEYIVGTKKLDNFDLSLGLGWGVLGSADNISNPFNSLHDSFKNRDADQGQGGNFAVKSWFSGETSLFAGLEYDLKKYGLRLKLEYDTSKPFENDKVSAKPKTDLNAGISYHLYDWLDLGLSYERGNQFRVSFSLTGDFFRDTLPKPKPKNVIKLDKNLREKASENKQIFYQSLNRSLRDESIYLQAATYDEDKLEISIATNRFFSTTRPVGRSARIASALLSDSVEEIIIRPMNGDMETSRITLNKKEFEDADQNEGSAAELYLKSKVESQSHLPLYENAEFQPTVDFPEFRWTMSPGLKHQIGGPEGFYLGQLYWRTDTSLKFARNLTLYTSIGLNIYDTFDFANPSFSDIPHVRSDIQEYLDQGKNNIARMQLEYMFSPAKDVYVRADLGLLEEMFGGLGGQVLYRPIKKRYAFGMSLHRVKQRDYDQRFSFRDYETTTGHLEFYAELPNDVFLQTYFGKYLAGDKGITLDLSRRYESGFVLGIFATKTNLSAEEFGEGSFDKGFYFSIPTKLFYPDFRSGVISFGLHPLTKDGGAFLSQQNQLFGIFGETNQHSILRDWDYLLD
tara:strand:- start:707 stop:2833 length:2127 start_codon:yes stop_codon:yes gene_type:complete